MASARSFKLDEDAADRGDDSLFCVAPFVELFLDAAVLAEGLAAVAFFGAALALVLAFAFVLAAVVCVAFCSVMMIVSKCWKPPVAISHGAMLAKTVRICPLNFCV